MQTMIQKMKHLDTSTQANDRAFIQAVTSHYKKSGRHDLPWRRGFLAYEILVSELMLQQTQVSRVISKYELWMKTYPTLAKLKKASLQDILVMWQGLGYQRRAKALYEIAQKCSSIPKTYNELIELPGIGPYTASAIMAFAYNTLGHPLVETNIRTALIEYFHVGKESVTDTMLMEDLKRLESYVSVKRQGARQWYLACMDYGSYLKTHKISHNQKVKGYTKQSPYKGSLRELRAQALFAITHKKSLPQDKRLTTVLAQLLQEGFIVAQGKTYKIA